MGILLHPTRDYEAKKAGLSPARREALELAEEAIAADPDDPRRLIIEGVTYEFTDDFVSVAFQRIDLHNGKLLSFQFYEDAV